MNTTIKTPTIGHWRKPILFASIVAMLTGLLFSRALLSSGLIVFVIVSIVHKRLIGQVHSFLASPLLWTMSLLFLFPFLSGLWSADSAQWAEVARIKLPLLLLPFCFAGINDFTDRDWQKVALIFVAIVFGGMCVSASDYLQHMQAIDLGYLEAHTIKTPLENDHVRFSLLVVISLLTVLQLRVSKRANPGKFMFILLLLYFLVGVVYLHVLAVRTGLICFYLGAIVFLFSYLQNSKHKTRFVLLLVLMAAVPLLSYFIFPTLRNRISYLKYDLAFIQKDTYQPGSNDGNRYASMKAGWSMLKKASLVGVGFGDIKMGADSFYSKNYPQMTMDDRILPSSEWMMYGAGTGWPGLILFTAVMIIPFFIRRVEEKRSWIMINIFIASSYLFDIGLEVQNGVFMHSFILLWWYKWTQQKE